MKNTKGLYFENLAWEGTAWQKPVKLYWNIVIHYVKANIITRGNYKKKKSCILFVFHIYIHFGLVFIMCFFPHYIFKLYIWVWLCIWIINYIYLNVTLCTFFSKIHKSRSQKYIYIFFKYEFSIEMYKYVLQNKLTFFILVLLWDL